MSAGMSRTFDSRVFPRAYFHYTTVDFNFVSLHRRDWAGWIRTNECRSQSPVPYHLATAQYTGDRRPRQDAFFERAGLEPAIIVHHTICFPLTYFSNRSNLLHTSLSTPRGSRTLMDFRPRDFKSRASTNSAMSAYIAESTFKISLNVIRAPCISFYQNPCANMFTPQDLGRKKMYSW